MEATHRVRFLAAVLSAAAFAGVPAPLRADLAASSPFLPANSPASAAAAGPAGPIELRGIMATAEGSQYCIYEAAKKKSTWVGLNENGHDFVIKTADSNADRVSVDYQGRIFQLELHAAKIASSGSGSAAAMNAVAGPVQATPTAAEEQRRLDAVAQEVRRRRLEREKALQDQTGAQQLPPGSSR
jgi:type II secretory pathway component PulC